MSKKHLAIFASVLTVTILVFVYFANLSRLSYTSPKVIVVTDATFEREVVDSPTSVLIMFHTANCEQCDRYKPVFHRAADKNAGKIKFVAIDDTTGAEICKMFGVEEGPATLYIAPNGGDKFMIKGYYGAPTDEELVQILDEVQTPGAELHEFQIRPSKPEVQVVFRPTPEPDKI